MKGGRRGGSDTDCDFKFKLELSKALKRKQFYNFYLKLMQRKVKKGVGHNKNFGPIQKLTVPDFQHISNVFEQMQSEILEKPAKARKQMKPFTIRKAVAPGQRAQEPKWDETAAAELGQSQVQAKTAPVGSNLTEEELDLLKPKSVQVVNPWIHEQTHKEYLENITGLPARHANVIAKHQTVVKEQTFLPKGDKVGDKDKATKKGLALLEKEYEFLYEGHDLAPVKALTRYDTWEQDKRTIEEWIEYCRARPDEPHALSPVFVGQEYSWKTVRVLGYDYEEKKYKVQVCGNLQEKLVTRLSLLFFDEDTELFKERVNICKSRQKNVEAELRFTDLVDSIPTDAVSTLSTERRGRIMDGSMKTSDKADMAFISTTYQPLLAVVQEEYIRQMKKCIILKEMQDPANHAKFSKLKMPVLLNKRTAPYFGVVMCAKYDFRKHSSEVEKKHWCSQPERSTMTFIFVRKCIDFQVNRYMQTNKSILKLPRELADIEKIQQSHHNAVSQNMIIQWRDFLISEIQEKLQDAFPYFFKDNEELYFKSELKPVITCYELMLNSFLREFVQTSIKEWTSFLQSFTYPKYEENEMWKRCEQPFLVIHLTIKRTNAGKSKEEKKTKDKKKKEKDDGSAKRVEYSPSLRKCQLFITETLEKVVESTNKVMNLESDEQLLPFLTNLQAKKTPSFTMTKEFPWILDSLKHLKKMFTENTVEPLALLNKFKVYEYILNIDRRKLVADLFKPQPKPELTEEQKKELEEQKKRDEAEAKERKRKGKKDGPKKEIVRDYGKATLEQLREQIEKFHQAEEEIMNLSNDTVNYTVFRVEAATMKTYLAHEAKKIKNALMEQVQNWCKESVDFIDKSFESMQKTILTIPQDEKELVRIREFIKQSRDFTIEELRDHLKEVERHHDMLDCYNFQYDLEHVELTYMQKQWASQIIMVIQDGNVNIAAQEDAFSVKLELEKDEFARALMEYEDIFNKIKTFHSSTQLIDFNKLSTDLKNKIDAGNDKIQNFKEREALFGQSQSEYPKLDELSQKFDPFHLLLQTTFEVKNALSDFQTTALMGQDYATIESQVLNPKKILFQLNRALIEAEYEDAAAVAMEFQQKLISFEENLPLIKCITSEAVDEEGWAQIKEACHKEDMERETITVSNFDELNLKQYTVEVEEIRDRCEKRFMLFKKLKGMKDEMKSFDLSQFPYKKTGTFVLKDYDVVNAKLDDFSVLTQGMLGSSYMRGKLATETRNWNAKLQAMSDLIEEIAKCQRTWMYLEPIFASDDIGKTLATETRQFQDVDNLWRATMDTIDGEPGILDLVERDNIKNQFEDANKKLDRIQKSLNDYLEEKRLIFPRFYFLANEDLLLLLAQTKDPRAVQPHMGKCFEGISKVKFSDKDEVLAIISAEDECVNLHKKIDVNEGERKGNVEKWMLDIEANMQKSLKLLTKDSLVDYVNTKRTSWVAKWPGQVVLAVDQTHWTTGVENAIKEAAQGGLEEYHKIIEEQINDIVMLVRGELTPGLRTTIKAMVVIDVHARDVVAELRDAEVANVNEFQWASQLRYYWEGREELKVKMVTATIDYGFEYLGNSLRLVITPLTDRCYRTLMGAKNLNYGGAPEGPAGTGKTESVKDLAKALAVQCVVFNCSDSLDHLAMAKFFKGLASSGCWCCFDEFNRIDVEVLSVIAQQILTIQVNILRKQKRFIFEDTELALNHACCVNITMNPGYAGRAELPDNLKALFRPCAMMVPDYVLIAEIELYSFGFMKARFLAIKVVASLRLSSEQLSSQDHYDFGMRALKAILTACGNLRRQLDWPEDQIGLRALNDVNLPKFTQNDIPLYQGITSDLFPGVVLPQPDYTVLLEAMHNTCKENNLQPKQEFLLKTIQLYETIMVRHGLMVVGGAFSGKSSIIKVLKEAISSIQNNPSFVNVRAYYINPKSILQDQLYGTCDPDTGEWADGVLAIKIKDFVDQENDDRKWVVLDGPVDAIWIENMNTVLDDNKKLCLNSGSIIKLKPTMTMMFEVEDLSQASPATVSRCGMVLLEPKQLGHTVLIRSYMNFLTSYIDKKVIARLEDSCHYLYNVCVEFVYMKCKFPVPTGPNFIVANALNLIDAFVKEWRHEERTVPKEAEEILQNALIFSAIWGIGAQIDEHTRGKFDQFLQEVINGEEVIVKYALELEEVPEPKKIPCKLGEYKSLFDMCYQSDLLAWNNWEKTVPPYEIPTNPNTTYAEVIVPTTDSIRIDYVMFKLLKNEKHTLIVGDTGTGKSITISTMLKRDFDNEENMFMTLAFSAQTSANQTQRIIDGKIDTRAKKGTYAPPLGKTGIIFVDDLNMPKKEIFGSQPPIELLRQWMDFGGWYEIDTPEKEFRKMQKVSFCAAMCPPGGGRNTITNRYTRHYNLLYVEPYSVNSLQRIFGNVLEWFFQGQTKLPFGKNITGLKDSIVASTIQVYEETTKKFRPTPAKSHYTFNLRDVSKVFQGITMCNPKGVRTDEEFIKLWAHECIRVFSDRLISEDDRNNFSIMLQNKVKERFKKDWNKMVQVTPLLFASFVPCIYPDGDTSKKAMQNIYTELTDRTLTKKVCEQKLTDFNMMNRNKQMDLVLFTDAIEHIAKIFRIINTQLGHALLVGVGGSGRKSLTELATFMNAFDIVTLEMNSGYDFTQWRDDVKNKLFMIAGIQAQQMVFLFSDTQINNEVYVEDINNILNNGEIPNLYNAEDMTNIIEGIKEENKNDNVFKRDIAEDSNAIFQMFTKQAKNNLHLVLAMSPIGEDFKRRLRMFPSLVNCCSIDWFLPWPKDALESVASHFLEKVEDLPEREGIVSICVDMQMRVQKLTRKYYEELRRYYYVTPTSYLILIKTFSTLLAQKRKKIFGDIDKFTKGLDQLEKAAEAVVILQAKLEQLIPLVKQKAEDAAVKQVQIEEQQKIVTKEKEECATEENLAKAEKNQADGIQADCDLALAEVTPLVKDAQAAVAALQSTHVTELKSFKQASVSVAAVAKALCVFFGVKPNKIRGQTKNEETKEDYWKPAQQSILNDKLLGRLQNYIKDNKDGAPQDIVDKINPILSLPEFKPDALKNASAACYGIGKWCKATIQYTEAMKIYNPKSAMLADAKQKSAAAQLVWDAARDRLAKVEAEMAQLLDDLAKERAEEQKLRSQQEEYRMKVELASALITGLADEKGNWVIQQKNLRQDSLNLIGDTVICSGIIAYLGIFIKSYRDECTSQWASMLRAFNIQSTENVSLEKALGNPVKIRQWQINFLPQDSFSTDNAIIWDYSDRWSLFIDPQMQANLWIKSTIRHQSDNLVSVKPTMNPDILIRKMKNAVNNGYPVLFEDATESFDPILDPLLSKNIERKGSEWLVKFGDTPEQYNSDFRLFITTKMQRPHYSPEVCVKLTMLNFMVTFDGLKDQMLSLVVKLEDPAKSDKRDQCIKQSAENKKKESELQERILNQVSSAGDQILENYELKRTLDESKEAQISIKQNLKEAKNTMDQIDKIREQFEPVAVRVARLFFVLTDLFLVDPMYQYSLTFFQSIFTGAIRSIDNANPPIEKKPIGPRKDYFIREFLRRLYVNVCRSLFAKDKLLFSFLIVLKIMDERLENETGTGLNIAELRFLMAGATQVELTKPNPTSGSGDEWLSDKAWASILEMSTKFKIFSGFDEDLAHLYLNEWKEICASPKPQCIRHQPWPGKWNDLSIFHRIMVLRIIRPDKVIPMIEKLICKDKEMGKDYIQSPPFDMSEILADSTNKTPIIIVLSPGADPMTEIIALAQVKNMRYEALSLGKGQDKKARDQIQKCTEEGTWVILQNCHLAPRFLQQLDAIIETIEEDYNKPFRVWLTTMPSDQFPVTIVQNGIKATSEPPKGLKANILKSFHSISDKELDECTKPNVFRRLLWGLVFFNALILERRKFGALGWNVPYEFSASDLKISKDQLKQFLDHYDKTPFEALTYMVAEANYGGRVTDPQDRRAIKLILSDFYCKEMVANDQHQIIPDTESYYCPPDGSKLEYLEFIQEKLPYPDETAIFGMHNNAAITSAINQTNQILNTALGLQPRSTGSAGKSQDEVLTETAQGILSKLPGNFDMDQAAKNHPIKYQDSMNTVLQQELLRYNKLLSEIRSSLINIGKAIRGEVVMSIELEIVCNALFDNTIPAQWKKKSYPSLKPLASYIVDLLERLKFLQTWVDSEAPPCFWVSGFFFTQSFLTGLKQNFARKYVIAIDLVQFEFEIISDPNKVDISTPASDGAYINGLFLEGCRWDNQLEVLQESHPKVLFQKMSPIWLKPAKTPDAPVHSYECPVYKTLDRRGTLSTTGHSTNFVTMINLPMQRRHTEKHWVKRGVALITQLND